MSCCSTFQCFPCSRETTRNIIPLTPLTPTTPTPPPNSPIPPTALSPTRSTRSTDSRFDHSHALPQLSGSKRYKWKYRLSSTVRSTTFATFIINALAAVLAFWSLIAGLGGLGLRRHQLPWTQPFVHSLGTSESSATHSRRYCVSPLRNESTRRRTTRTKRKTGVGPRNGRTA